MNRPTPLTRAKLPIDTVSLARFLIGKLVVRELPEGRIISDDELDRLTDQIALDIKHARESEERQRDFVMDLSSFRRECEICGPCLI